MGPRDAGQIWTLSPSPVGATRAPGGGGEPSLQTGRCTWPAEGPSPGPPAKAGRWNRPSAIESAVIKVRIPAHVNEPRDASTGLFFLRLQIDSDKGIFVITRSYTGQF